MEDETKSPYFSVRTRMGDVTSPKDMVGLKDFTCEITLGNQDTIKISNPADFADVKQKDIFDLFRDVFKKRDAFGKEMGFTFVDQVVKYGGTV